MRAQRELLLVVGDLGLERRVLLLPVLPELDDTCFQPVVLLLFVVQLVLQLDDLSLK